MKKLTLSFLAIIGIYTISDAKTISQTNARDVAKKYYAQISEMRINKFDLAFTEKTPAADTSVYFIFNINDNDGWVILSADDATYPILGYSESGHYKHENLSPEFKYWMEKYKNQIIDVKRNDLPASQEIIDEWIAIENNNLNSSTRASVKPLLTTTWDQWTYYNAQCPSGTPTGCVATAMAQIMKYWNYPTHGTGSHSYGNLSANFGNTTYDWSCMPHTLNSANSAVAKLMFHCGVSVEMDYGPNESGAWVLRNDYGGTHPYPAEYAYYQVFGYDPLSIHGKLRTSYSTTAWIGIIKGDLNHDQPVQYAGWSSSGGHTWVCDGYDANNKFHMNWGWGGSFNGYFSINALNPGGTSYNHDEEVLIGIKPKYSYPRCSNDECINATTLFACNRVIVNNYQASASSSIPGFSCYTGTVKDIWFKINPTTNSLSVETYQSSCSISDLVLQAFSGTCGNLTRIACDDNSGSASHGRITLTNLPNLNPIYIRVTDKNGDDFGEFGIYYKKISQGSNLFSEQEYIAGDGDGVNTYPTLKGDVNGDGKIDLIFVGQNWSGNGLNVRTKMSNGNGSFTEYSQVFSDGAAVHTYPTLTGDINGDGKTDLIFPFYSSTNGLTIRTKMSNGNGTYTSYQDILGDGSAVFQNSTLTGDVNGDGKTDLIFPFYSNTNGLTIRTKMSNGNGSFTAYQDIRGDGNAVFQYSTLTGDINGDGKTDLIFPFYSNTNGLTIRTKMSNGDGTYTPFQDICGDGSGVFQYSTRTGDINGDGKTDLIFPIYSSTNGLTIRTKMSNGDGSFTPYQDVLGDGIAVFDYPTRTGDINGDGKTDLIFNGQNWNGCGLNVRVKFSNGDGTWCGNFQTLGDGDAVHDYPLITGDINGDGKTDLIFKGQDWSSPGLNIRTKISQSTSCNMNVSVEKISAEQKFSIFPNPSDGNINISTENFSSLDIKIMDETGKIIQSYSNVINGQQIDISQFENGIYLIEILNILSNERIVDKIVKIN